VALVFLIALAISWQNPGAYEIPMIRD